MGRHVGVRYLSQPLDESGRGSVVWAVATSSGSLTAIGNPVDLDVHRRVLAFDGDRPVFSDLRTGE